MIQSEQRLIQYLGNGVTTVFAIPFVFHSKPHIYLYKEEIATGIVTPLIHLTHYALTGQSNPSGGTATLFAAPSSAFRITILRFVPYEQLTDYINNDRFDAEVHERQMDLIIMMVQQLADPDDLGGRSLKFPPTESPAHGTILPHASLRKNTVIGFDPITGEMVLYQLPMTVVSLVPPPDGTWVYGAVDGVPSWLSTQDCG